MTIIFAILQKGQTNIAHARSLPAINDIRQTWHVINTECTFWHNKMDNNNQYELRTVSMTKRKKKHRQPALVQYLCAESRHPGQQRHGQHLDDQHARPEGVRAEHLIVDGDQRSQRHDDCGLLDWARVNATGRMEWWRPTDCYRMADWLCMWRVDVECVTV